MARRIWNEEEDGSDKEPENSNEPSEETTAEVPQTASPNGWTRVIRTSSREEMISSLKRGECPTWVPRERSEVILARPMTVIKQISPFEAPEGPEDRRDQAQGLGDDIEDSKKDTQQPLARPDEIDRPGSALHSGDFHESPPPRAAPLALHDDSLPMHAEAGSRHGSRHFPSAWDNSSKPPSFSRFHADLNQMETFGEGSTRRSRAPSLGSSLSSSFVKRTPTSPLVYSAINAEPELIPTVPLSPSVGPDKHRRRTLPAETLQDMNVAAGTSQPPNFSRPLPAPRREASFPYQSHQPRRSLTSFTYQPLSNPQTPPFPRVRRPSMSSDTSPSQRASMVGSFEESIIRGRMSAPASRPLEFLAEIGVLGKGNCPPSLLVPPHVFVPFSAVFYNYPSTSGSRSLADDSPSPYVGNIDLEGTLEPAATRKHRKRHVTSSKTHDEPKSDNLSLENASLGQPNGERQKTQEERQKRRRSESPKAPPGGCYRVPQQGQLQIIIKHPDKKQSEGEHSENKHNDKKEVKVPAVKVYLVPYDLTGMQPGTRTFVRQRCFSSGPILEMPLSGGSHHIPLVDPLKDKQILRYLIHLKFCCLTQDRFYVYDNIRVVFANRVPEAKEKLRNEIQLPEPRFSTYRTTREVPLGSAGAKLATDKAFRRRSSGFSITGAGFDAMEGLVFDEQSNIAPPPLPPSGTSYHFSAGTRRSLAKSEPSHDTSPSRQTNRPLQSPNRPEAEGEETNGHDKIRPPESLKHEEALSPTTGFVASTSARGSPVPWSPDGGDLSTRSYSPAPAEPGGGLLAKRLRDHATRNGTKIGTENSAHDTRNGTHHPENGTNGTENATNGTETGTNGHTEQLLR